MKKKILITGGAGYIGSMLVTELVYKGNEVTVLDKLNYSINSLSHLFSFKNFNLIIFEILKKPFFMKKYLLITIAFCSFQLKAQTAQDTIDIKRVALAYIEAQHTPNPKLMESALHPRLVKRSVFSNFFTWLQSRQIFHFSSHKNRINFNIHSIFKKIQIILYPI